VKFKIFQKPFMTPRAERLLNVWLFLFFGWGSWLALGDRLAEGLTAVEISFIAQNWTFCAVVLLRKTRRDLSGSLIAQGLALAAFASGLGFLSRPAAGLGPLAAVGQALMIGANALAVVSLLTLGRSFGILVARRELKVGGVYRLVRHPMYLSDISLRLGFCLVSQEPAVWGLLVLSVLLYWGRAVCEEKFLNLREDYRQYARRVRWRFLPGLI
jgi:protein-S-isoprenylcysteine O-methyltransferase Ste14